MERGAANAKPSNRWPAARLAAIPLQGTAVRQWPLRPTIHIIVRRGVTQEKNGILVDRTPGFCRQDAAVGPGPSSVATRPQGL